MATQEARVELLTAEVRVLMVGSRQVTLSVARQLDRVPLREMEPFGRVRLDREYTDEKYGGDVIGKHKDTGALVIACWDRTPVLVWDQSPSIKICSYWEWTFNDQTFYPRYSHLLPFKGYPVKIVNLKTCTEQYSYDHNVHSCGNVYAWLERHEEREGKSLRDLLEEEFDRFEREELPLHRKAATLPLIVLAGLK